MEKSRRITGLIDFIAGNYSHTAEIGIGHLPDIALSLLRRGVRVFATDIRPIHYKEIPVVIDDVTAPDYSLYQGVDLIYSMRPPPELIPYMISLAKRNSVDLVVKMLSSEFLNQKLMQHTDATFYFWKHKDYPRQPL